jgi:uncharacterized protein YukE
MPGGDPSALEELAAKLEAAAQGAGDIGASTRQLASSIRSGADWTGDAAGSYTDFTTNLRQGPIDAEQPLSQIASAVPNYAGVLRTTQEKVQTYSSLAQAAQNDTSGSMISTAEHAGQDASSAVSALQQAASQAAGQVTSAHGDLENLAGKTGPVQSCIKSQPGLGMTATEPGSGTIKDPIREDLGTGTTIDPVAEDLGGSTIIDPIPEDLGTGTTKDPSLRTSRARSSTWTRTTPRPRSRSVRYSAQAASLLGMRVTARAPAWFRTRTRSTACGTRSSPSSARASQSVPAARSSEST